MNAHDVPLEIFADARSGERNLRTLHALFMTTGSRFSPDEFTRTLSAALRASPDPDLSLSNLLRYSEVVVSPVALFNDLLHHHVLLDILMKILGNSRFFGDLLVRDPSLFRWLTASAALNTPLTAEEVRGDVDHVLASFGAVDRRLDGIRRMYRRQLLRVGARDILGIADLPQITRELSLLADGSIDAVLRCIYDQIREKGDPVPDIPFAVLGLGKLGGAELNYSSDIDLMFVYAEDTADDTAGRVQASFQLLSEKLVQHLSRVTGEGHLFRVDMRLRPEAGAGPLARSLQSYLLYYESRGELWERQMLIKARPVAGDEGLGAAFLQGVHPFVYPRAFLEHPAESISRMKARIESTLGDAANIKLMPGGIRDIEFIVQALQLLNGGKKPALRTGNTLEALRACDAEGVLPGDDVQALEHAYTFYRTLEHRLQTMLNTQTHTIPRDEREHFLLARRMGFASVSMLTGTLEQHLSAVRAVFERTLATHTGTGEAGLEAAIDGALTEERTTRLLADHGFRDVRQALRHMRTLAFGSTLTGVRETDTRSRTAFRSVAASLFRDIAASPDPDLTLHSLSIIAGGQKFLGGFYHQLTDAHFRRFMIDTCAIGPRFARIMAARPALMESFTSDPAALGSASGSGVPPVEELHEFKIQQEVRAGLRHLLGLSSFDEMTAGLSATAEFVLREVFAATVSSHHGNPQLALFALGKLGTRELTFDADLDLLFVADAHAAEERSGLERIAAGCVKTLSAVTEHGRLYDIDVRLRPEGRNAPLVIDRTAYQTYLSQRASLWERQSLTRLRFICGDAALGAAVEKDVRSFVFDSPLPAGWTADTIAMRKTMESRTRTRRDEIIDIKLGPGGMVDVEFLAQMLMLLPGAVPPEGRHGSVPTILGLSHHGILPARERDEMVEAYRLFRRLELFLRVTMEERGSVLPTGKKLATLARCALGTSGDAVQRTVRETMKRVRAMFLHATDRLNTFGAPSQ